jgi:hypothetical protein
MDRLITVAVPLSSEVNLVQRSLGCSNVATAVRIVFSAYTQLILRYWTRQFRVNLLRHMLGRYSGTALR